MDPGFSFKQHIIYVQDDGVFVINTTILLGIFILEH